MHDTTYKILIWIFYPILYLLGHVLSHYGVVGGLHPKDWADEYSLPYLRSYRNHVPKPLLMGRRRCLTLPSPSSSFGFLPASQVPKGQSQSPLFSKLPAEIRSIIFGMALSGNGQILHMVRPTAEFFKHIRCKLPPGRCRDYECFTYWTPDPEDPKKQGTFHGTHGGLLPLILTCRRIYTEAIPLLYTHNTFSFNDIYPLFSFPSTILPDRRQSIQSLHLNLTIKPDRLHLEGGDIDLHPLHGCTVWKQAGSVLALMTGLKDLRVVFGVLAKNTEVLDERQEMELLMPLMEVRHVRKFVVVVGWYLRFQVFDGRARSDVPFELEEVVDQG